MNKLLMVAAVLVSGVAVADMPSNDALMSMMKKIYADDMQTAAGRQKWHGKLVSQNVDTNALVKIDAYADGYVITNAWRLVRPIDPVERQHRKINVQTNGVPAKLAEARLRRARAIETPVSNVTVRVDVGHGM